MISHLSGTILFRGSRSVILDVGGVGYQVFLSSETLRRVPGKGLPMKLFTRLYTRENAMELYGFETLSELEFFEALITISGIGPKSALGILSVAPLDQLKRAIGAGEVKHLTKVAGIGRKTAEKIVLELRDKLGAGKEGDGAFFAAESDALDALLSLGYTRNEARDALKKVPEDISAAEKRIAAALKVLGKNA